MAEDKAPAWVGIVVIIAILAFLWTVFKSPSTTGGSVAKYKDSIGYTQNDTGQLVNPILNESAPKYVNVHDTAYLGDMKYKIIGLGYNKELGTEYYDRTTNNYFLVIRIQVWNMGNVSHLIDNGLFELADSEGRLYKFSAEGITALSMEGDNIFVATECNPGITKRGYLCFEIPKKGSYSLGISNGSDNSVIIGLGNKIEQF
jgi:hypothetical protein